MSAEIVVGEYVIEALNGYGGICPLRYMAMLEETPANRVIETLSPWAFLPDPQRSSTYCSEAAGYPVLPFAQAVEQDVVACFVAQSGAEPTVIVLNPWSANQAGIVLARLPNYDAWLDYAAEVSRQVQAREAEEGGD